MKTTMQHIHPRSSARRQQGLSLVELMIGITIGLLVVLAAIGSLSYTRVSSVTVGDSARLQQEAANAFRILGHHIRSSGARRIVPSAGNNFTFNSSYTGFGTDPNTFSSLLVQGTEGSGTTPDTLRLSHDAEPDLGATDCIGELPVAASANNVQNRFFYFLNAQGVGELRCQGSGTSTVAVAGGLPLVQGVDDFQVWYGFQTGVEETATLVYRTATQVTATNPPPWEQVVSVMVCLRMSGESTGNPGVATAGCLPNQVIANNGRISRTFFRVFNIRNAGL